MESKLKTRKGLIMNESTEVNELFNVNVPIDFEIDDDVYKAGFYIDDNEYIVYINKEKFSREKAEKIFGKQFTLADGIYPLVVADVTFTRFTDDGETFEIMNDMKTGVMVFSEVINILRQFMHRQKDIDILYFRSDAASRTKLYMAMARKLVKIFTGYKFMTGKTSGSSTMFFIYKQNVFSEGIEEVKMTEPMKKERERIVKGMKKDTKGFKNRYGDDWKSVMYATATKHAVSEELIESCILSEEDDKNTHMTHIEDLVFLKGIDGVRRAIMFFRDLRDMLSGHSDAQVDVSVKWDGSPAVFAGIDPEDGKFFVAKKGLFAKTPKLYKSEGEVKSELSGELQQKFIVAFNEFKKLNIRSGVYQGDMMFTKSDLKKQKIDGVAHYTFQPNTIMYAVPVNSTLGKKMARAQIGVVWHTTYSGSSIANLQASFGKTIVDKMKQTPSVWMDDATYKDVSGTANFTVGQTKEVNELLSEAGRQFQKFNSKVVNELISDQDLKIKLLAFTNSYIRGNKPWTNGNSMSQELVVSITDFFDKEIEAKKTEKGKNNWREKKDSMLGLMNGNLGHVAAMFDIMIILARIKMIFVNQMNKTSQTKTLLVTKNGFEVTNQEGFVAIDRIGGSAVKLVDRMEFSKANFSPEFIKGWQH